MPVNLYLYKMQRQQISLLVPPTDELYETYVSYLILAIRYYVNYMTSSTKPEVHNVFYCCQRRTDPRPK